MPHVTFHIFPVPEFSSPAFSTPRNMVPIIPVSRFPPPVTWCRYFHSRIFQSRFSAPSRSFHSWSTVTKRTTKNYEIRGLNPWRQKLKYYVKFIPMKLYLAFNVAGLSPPKPLRYPLPMYAITSNNYIH